MAANGGDPGWGHALRGAWLDVLVPFPQFALWRSRREGRDSLTTLRLFFMSSVVTSLLVADVTWIVHGGASEEGSMSVTLFLGLAALQGVLGLAMIRSALRRAPEVSGAEEVAGWFNAVTLLGMSLSQASFLVGFVGTFVTNEPAMIFAGLPFALAGYWMSTPTRRRLAGAQRQLTRAGVSVDLVDALRTTPFKRAGAGASRTRSDEGTATPPPS